MRETTFLNFYVFFQDENEINSVICCLFNAINLFAKSVTFQALVYFCMALIIKHIIGRRETNRKSERRKEAQRWEACRRGGDQRRENPKSREETKEG